MEEHVKRAQEIKRLANVEIDVPGIKLELRSYQKRDVAFLVVNKRSLLGEVVGSGKSAIAITTIKYLINKQKIKNCLFVTTSSLLYQTKNEVEKFSNMSCIILRGTPAVRQKLYKESSKFDISIVNYETLRQDIEYFVNMEFSMVVLDESTMYKSISSKLYTAVRRISNTREYVVAMTATPLQNNLSEIYSIMSVVNPEIFNNYWQFKSRYLIEKEITIKRPGRQPFKFRKVVGYKNVPEFAELISNYYIRHPKDFILSELPPVTHEYRFVTLTSEQQKIYDKIKEGILKKGNEIHKLEVLQKFYYMLSVCTANHLADEDVKTVHSSKYDEFLQLVQNELKDERAVVYCERKRSIEYLRKELKKVGITSTEITGDVKAEEREKNKQSFIDGTSQIIFLTTAGEMGLNLQCAGYFIFINQMYNPARMEQLAGRILRIGQTHEKVVIFHIVTENTVESRVLDLLEKKKGLFDAVFGKAKEVTVINKQVSGIDNLSVAQMLKMLKDE